MKLTDLNDDVLYLVLSELEHDKRTLLNLARTSIRLAKSARRHIFRHVELRFFPSGRDMRDKAAQLLARSLEEDPTLKEVIRTVVIHDVVLCHRQQIDVDAILIGIPYLEFLHIGRRWNSWPGQGRAVGPWRGLIRRGMPQYPRPLGKEFELGFLRPNSLLRVPSVEIKGDFTVQEIVELMVGTKAERFVAEDFMMSNAAEHVAEDFLMSNAEVQFVPEKFAHTSTNTRILHLLSWRYWSMDLPVFKKLLMLPENLQELECWLPGRCEMPQGRCGQGVQMAHSFSGKALFDALSPVKSTLTRLVLTEAGVIKWPSRDNTPLDLSDFHNLEVAHLPSICFFPTGAPQPLRDELCSLLPSSIAELEIMFDAQTGIFYDADEQAVLTRGMIEKIEDSRTRWIARLLERKDQELLNLQLLRLIEDNQKPCPARTRYPTRPQIDWTLPPYLHKEATNRRIDVFVTLRVPHELYRNFSNC